MRRRPNKCDSQLGYWQNGTRGRVGLAWGVKNSTNRVPPQLLLLFECLKFNKPAAAMAAACDTGDQLRLRNSKGGFSRGLDDDEEVGFTVMRATFAESRQVCWCWHGFFVGNAFSSCDAATLGVDPMLNDSTGCLSHGEHQLFWGYS